MNVSDGDGAEKENQLNDGVDRRSIELETAPPTPTSSSSSPLSSPSSVLKFATDDMNVNDGDGAEKENQLNDGVDRRSIELETAPPTPTSSSSSSPSSVQKSVTDDMNVSDGDGAEKENQRNDGVDRRSIELETAPPTPTSSSSSPLSS